MKHCLYKRGLYCPKTYILGPQKGQNTIFPLTISLKHLGYLGFIWLHNNLRLYCSKTHILPKYHPPPSPPPPLKQISNILNISKITKTFEYIMQKFEYITKKFQKSERNLNISQRKFKNQKEI